MANSIQAAPSVLADSVIASLKNKLPVLNGFSSVFSSQLSGQGLTIQVPLIGTSTATEFSTGGYLTQDDATVTKADVALKHYKVSTRVTPLNVRDYGMSFFQNFAVTASNALAQKCMDDINALITSSNFAASATIGADFSYDEAVVTQKTLDDAKAANPRAIIVNSDYLADLRSDSKIVAANGLGANVISSGAIGTLAGASVYQFANLASNSQDLSGFACGADAIAVATALPLTEIPGFDVAVGTDADTGLSVQIIMGQEQSGYYNITATLLFGCAVGRATSLVRLKTA
jgi:hypothetical protein